MRVVQMNNNGPQTNGLAEINPDVQDKHKETRDGVMGEGQELSEEDESQNNEDAEHHDDDNDHDQLVALSARSQQHQGPLVCWEWFLPLRSLKVLLVENDDSTRHVVSALLRNCGYEVTAVANGLQAWKILEDLRNHFDLVLTEVVMPCLSGIGLLCKIMNHKTCKNIPVIMMSSHGSMSVVFKCLSKGAVDFLVKPIRKNELKNLWQHVWRKCHSSSGSGSESGVRTQKFTKSKGAEESDNNIGSSDEDDIASVGPNARDGSDHGSGTQSSWSWTKRAIEVDSPKPMSPQDQAAAPLDSTCAQVMHSRPEALGNKWVPVNMIKDCDGKDADLGNVVDGKDLEIGVPRIPNLQPEQPSEKVSTKVVDSNGENLPESVSKKAVEQAGKAQLEPRIEKPYGKSRNQLVDIAGMNTNSIDPNTVFDIPSYLFKVSNQEDKAIGESEDTPCLELSLKRLRDVADIGNGAKDRNVLRRSDISAFSRYSSGSTTNQAPTMNVGSCSPLDTGSDAVKTDSIQNFQSNSNNTPPTQHSNGSSNNNNMGSTTNNVFNKPLVISDKHALKSTVKVSHPSSDFQAMHCVDMLCPQPVKGDVTISNNILAEARDKKHQAQVEHHYHHHRIYNMQQQQLGNYESLGQKTMVAAAPQCGSSNMLSSHINSIVRSYSLSRSASGSNHGSNGLNDSNIAPNPNGTNAEIDNGATGEAKAAYGIGNRAVVDQNRLTQREAALNKFHQKRKARCFEKKVRYQSRKKLAEQRPRIRGQFVRQATTRGIKERDALS